MSASSRSSACRTCVHVGALEHLGAELAHPGDQRGRARAARGAAGGEPRVVGVLRLADQHLADVGEPLPDRSSASCPGRCRRLRRHVEGAVQGRHGRRGTRHGSLPTPSGSSECGPAHRHGTRANWRSDRPDGCNPLVPSDYRLAPAVDRPRDGGRARPDRGHGLRRHRGRRLPRPAHRRAARAGRARRSSLLVAATLVIGRRGWVVRLGDEGYRVQWVRGVGVAAARWKDVEDAVTTTRAGLARAWSCACATAAPRRSRSTCWPATARSSSATSSDT